MNSPKRAGLDRPIWAALGNRQRHLGQGDELARRYRSDVAPFAALAEETAECYVALQRLLMTKDEVALLSREPLHPIDTLHATSIGPILQMVAVRRAIEVDDEGIVRLDRGDVGDMIELAQRTKPGPFGKSTIEMGSYIGVRDQGRLVAMAGERMQLDGYVEISAVCVDEAWRGRGLAARLMNILRKAIEQRGDTPFLHVFHHNTAAIELYERLGFVSNNSFLLSRLSVARSEHEDPGQTAG